MCVRVCIDEKEECRKMIAIMDFYIHQKGRQVFQEKLLGMNASSDVLVGGCGELLNK